MTLDLSTIHQPVSEIFAGNEAIPLSDEQLSQFEEQGYVAGVQVLSEAQVEALRQDLLQLIDPHAPGNELFYEFHTNEATDPNTVLFHALGHWRITPGFHDLLWNRAMLAPAAQLLGGPVRFWHDQLFCKPAKHGGVVAWHQDYSYWTRTSPMAHLTCWIALDDAHRDNGCITYVPGSHRWDLLPVTGLAGDMEAIREVLTEEQFEGLENPVYVELKAGQAAFHHPLMVHGSRENRTDGPRRAAVVNLVRDGVCSQSDTPLLEGVPVIPAGEPLGGQFFPLLWDAG